MSEIIDEQAVQNYLLDLQNRLCQMIESTESEKTFLIDDWERTKGWGSTRLIEDGSMLERGGVNFSMVEGDHLPSAATAKRPELAGCSFKAMGVSVVFHPVNPYIPTAHMNVRLFVGRTPAGKPIWWFGGGFDLTPYYPFDEDCVYWHQMAERACRPFGKEVYAKYKDWCDEYFYLKHRQETRGVGGLFFDDLNDWPFETCFEFIRSVGDHFLEAYHTLVKRRMAHPFRPEEKTFQQIRRGRYVEFNLVYDRGTLFGLQYGGRIESILMSLPKMVEWRYQYEPAPGSREALLCNYLKPRDWLNFKLPEKKLA